MPDRIHCASIILIIISIGFLIGGILLVVLGDSIIKKIVRNECQLKPGTMLYNNWHDSPVPLYISFYVFDLNNTEFLNGTSKPHVKQRGPFVYKEERKKIDVRMYENQTISYRELRSYTFDPSKSAELDTVNITAINLVYMVLVNYLQMEDVSPTFRKIVGNLLADQEKPIMKLSVKEYIWGYQDPLLYTLKSQFPELITDDQVSVYNASVREAGSNTFLINNGVSSGTNNTERINNVGQIERFNFERSLPFWSNEYANMINGTDSTIWHPNTKANERIYAFISDICRSVYLGFNETNMNKFNIKTYHYTTPNSVFAKSTENEGFCLNSTTSNKTHEIECLSSGLFSLKSCILLSNIVLPIPLPIIGSNPHFLAADSSIQNGINGLTPDDIKHRSFMDIEPLTGVVMNGSRRLQINLNVVNDSAISAIARLNSFVYPMIWVDEHAEIDKTNADKFYNKVTKPIMVLHIMKYVILGIGTVLFIIVIILLAYRRYKASIFGLPFEKPNADETSPLLF